MYHIILCHSIDIGIAEWLRLVCGLFITPFTGYTPPLPSRGVGYSLRPLISPEVLARRFVGIIAEIDLCSIELSLRLTALRNNRSAQCPTTTLRCIRTSILARAAVLYSYEHIFSRAAVFIRLPLFRAALIAPCI